MPPHGGHGRAWTYFAESKVALASSICEGRGAYTNLSLEHGLMAPDGRCPLSQIVFDEGSYVWSSASRPGGYRHITLEDVGRSCVDSP